MAGVDGQERSSTDPSPSDFDRWRDLVLNGAEPGDAARELGFSGSSTFGRTNPERHGEVLDLWRELRATRAAKSGMTALLDVADDGEAPPAARVSAANTLVRIGGLLVDRTEVTGADGGPVEVVWSFNPTPE